MNPDGTDLGCDFWVEVRLKAGRPYYGININYPNPKYGRVDIAFSQASVYPWMIFLTLR